MNGIELKIEQEGGRAVVSVIGEIDLTSAPRLDEEITSLIEGSTTNIAIELGGVSFMDSTGLRVLLKASKLLGSNGGTLVLRDPSEPVQRLLEVSGLNTHFEITPGADRASD